MKAAEYCAFGFVLLASQCIIALQLSGNTVIEGQVISAGNVAVAVENAQVELNRQDGSSRVLYVDGTGRFRFEGVGVGAYRLRVTAAGYVASEYGKRTSGLPGFPLVINGVVRPNPLLFRIVPTANLSGSVYDFDGEPLAYVVVQLLKRQYSTDGDLRIVADAFVRTDDRGEYRFYWIDPGEYYVSAMYTANQLGPAFVAINPNRSPVRDGYLPHFYPGTSDASRAERISLSPGQDMVGVNFNLRQNPTATVRGMVTSSVTGRGVAAPILISASRNVVDGFSFQSRSDVSGRFQVSGIPFGTYSISAVLPGREPLAAYTSLRVGQDVEVIDIVLTAGLAISGNARAEKPNEKPDLGNTVVRLIPSFVGPPNVNGRILPNGAFRLGGIPSGNFRLRILGLPADYYVKSARFGRADALKEDIHIAGTIEEQLDILLSDEGGSIQGTVFGRDNTPVGGATVALLPTGEQRGAQVLYKVATTAQTGKFSMRGITPGNYELFAWEDLESGAYFNSDFIKKYQTDALPLAVEPKSSHTLEIRVLE